MRIKKRISFVSALVAMAALPQISKADAVTTYRNIRFEGASIRSSDKGLDDSGIVSKFYADGNYGNTDTPFIFSATGSGAAVARYGSQGIRYKANPTPSAPVQDSKQRCEHGIWETSINKEHWSGFSIKREHTDVPAEGTWNIVHQWWQDGWQGGNPANGGFSPPIAISIKTKTTNPTTSEHKLTLTRVWGDASGSQWIEQDLCNFSNTTWTDIAVQWKIAPAGNAILKVYVNNMTTPVVNLSGPTFKLGYADTIGGGNRILEKMGIYRKAPQSNTISILYDQVRIGTNGSAGLAAVNPASNFDTWINGDWAGRWKFDNNTGAPSNYHDYDTSGHGNSMDIIDGIGNGTNRVTGKVGQAVKFDGVDDRVHVLPSSGALADKPLKYDGTGVMTIAFWINIDSDETNGGYLVTKPYNTAASGEYNYAVGLTADRKISIAMTPGQGVQNFTHVFSNILNSGQWYLVTLRIEPVLNSPPTLNKRITLFLNRVYSATATYSVTDFTPAHGDLDLPICIGSLYPHPSSMPSNSAASFKGILDEVRIWRRALSAAELAALE